MSCLVKILGAFPYKLVNNVYQKSPWCSLYSAVTLIWLIFDFIWFTAYLDDRRPDLNLYLIVCEKFFTLLANSIPIINYHRNVDRVNLVNGELHRVDDVLKSLEITVNDKNPVLLSIIVSVTILISILIEGDFDRGSGRITSGLIMMFLLLGQVLRISVDVNRLGARIRVLNDTLELQKQRCQDRQWRRSISKLLTVCYCHRTLCAISETINDMFSTQMMSFKLFCILFLGVVATSMAASVSSEEASESNEVERGISKDSKGNDRCTCDNVSCQCCVTPKIPKVGSLPCCLRIQIDGNRKLINLILNVKGRQVINSQYRIGARDEKCAAVPGTLNTIKGCVDTDTSNLPNNAGLQTCARIAVKGIGSPIASLIFPCVQLANGRVSLNDRGEVKAKDRVKVKLF